MYSPLHSRPRRVFSLISGLWVGGLISIGFFVVPVLFSTLGDRQIAGMVAAKLFKFTAFSSVGISAALMVMANYFVRHDLAAYRLIRWILLMMLACAVGAAFILIPWMNSLRDQALLLGLSVKETTHATLFARLHGISSILFMTQVLFGLVLVWLATKNAD